MTDYKICTCGVPLYLHGTSCGYNNAKAIIGSDETTVVANMTGEEKRERFLNEAMKELLTPNKTQP